MAVASTAVCGNSLDGSPNTQMMDALSSLTSFTSSLRCISFKSMTLASLTLLFWRMDLNFVALRSHRMLTRRVFHSDAALLTACALIHPSSCLSRASISNLDLSYTSAHIHVRPCRDTHIYAFISSTSALVCPRNSSESVANCRLKSA